MKELYALSDHQLLEYCRNGNDKAFDIIFQRYFKPLYSLSLKYVRNTEIAEELVMDLMMWMWEKRGTDFCPDGTLKAYLFQAMRNSVISFFRRKTLATQPIELYHEETMQDSKHADHDQIYAEIEACFQKKLGELSPQRRKVYEMSRNEEMTYPQIARKLNLSANTVKSHISFSLNHLRKSLHEHLDVTGLIILLSTFIK
ncbi:RNA polymerase sigma-E factor [compost metagenome]|uniref:RNA polymerase sigma factor n=1 Tax=Pedobacter sp. ok626 TaxID=1761882 RepID=UPI0008827AD5|nr:RNA polymerase sigma-70 factor [Pedobacter sp. ok626]SDK85703.1 RNA polymerase sigma-70 factor, ECF subfamily [Pedobacter sp. ok626]